MHHIVLRGFPALKIFFNDIQSLGHYPLAIFKSPIFIADSMSTSIRIRFSSSSGLSKCRHIYGSDLLMLTGIVFFGEDEMLVTRTKIA